MSATKHLRLIAMLAISMMASSLRAEQLYTTNGTSISRFDSTALGTVITVGVSGLNAGASLVDIDVRPADQLLYGLSSDNRLYTINPVTGVATAVGSGGTYTLNGTAFGIDFNPIPDRLRVVSNTEQNLRINPNDNSLAATDTNLTPAGNVVSVAYDRNFPRAVGDSTPTTLYGIDSAAGTLLTIGSINGSPNSPNGGQTTTVGSLGLGTNLNENIGFDISGGGTAFASITTGGNSRLYTINLVTGAATLAISNAGSIGNGTTPYLGLAAANVPEPAAFMLSSAALSLFAISRSRKELAR